MRGKKGLTGEKRVEREVEKCLSVTGIGKKSGLTLDQTNVKKYTMTAFLYFVAQNTHTQNCTHTHTQQHQNYNRNTHVLAHSHTHTLIIKHTHTDSHVHGSPLLYSNASHGRELLIENCVVDRF